MSLETWIVVAMIIGGAAIASVPLYFMFPSVGEQTTNPAKTVAEEEPAPGLGVGCQLGAAPCIFNFTFPSERSGVHSIGGAYPYPSDRFNTARDLDVVKVFIGRFPYTDVYNEDFYDAEDLQKANITDNNVRYRLTYTYTQSDEQTQYVQTRKLIILMDEEFKVYKTEFVCINREYPFPSEIMILPATKENVDRACPFVKSSITPEPPK